MQCIQYEEFGRGELKLKVLKSRSLQCNLFKLEYVSVYYVFVTSGHQGFGSCRSVTTDSHVHRLCLQQAVSQLPTSCWILSEYPLLIIDNMASCWLYFLVPKKDTSLRNVDAETHYVSDSNKRFVTSDLKDAYSTFRLSKGKGRPWVCFCQSLPVQASYQPSLEVMNDHNRHLISRFGHCLQGHLENNF